MYREIYDTNSKRDLTQGDVINPTFNPALLEILDLVNKGILGFQVLSYTCDLDQNKLTHLLLAPIYKFTKLIDVYIDQNIGKSKKNIKENIEPLIKNIMENKKHRIFFLPPLKKWNHEAGYSDIGHIVSLPISSKLNVIGNRIASLKSPWIEKLAEKLGAMFFKIAMKGVSKKDVGSYLRDINIDERIEKKKS